MPPQRRMHVASLFASRVTLHACRTAAASGVCEDSMKLVCGMVWVGIAQLLDVRRCACVCAHLNAATSSVGSFWMKPTVSVRMISRLPCDSFGFQGPGFRSKVQGSGLKV